MQDTILGKKKEFAYFTPGPSELYPTVADHLADGLVRGVFSISHRSEAFMALSEVTKEAVRAVLGIPADFRIFFAGSATEWMERSIENCVERESFHFVNGAFSKKFKDIAADLGRDAKAFEVPFGEGFTLDAFDIPRTAELIAITHNETSSGVMLPVSFIEEVRHRAPESIIAVDIVSSAPYVELDYAHVDIVFFSVQKGFGLPAGLGVAAVSPRALARAEERKNAGRSIGSFHSFLSLAEKDAKHQTPETPNVLGIHLLGEVCKDLLAKGMDEVRRETDEKAALLYKAVAESPFLKPAVADEAFRSRTVVPAEVEGGSAPLIARAKEQGFIIGSGYKERKASHIRIANFPAHSVEAVRELTHILTT